MGKKYGFTLIELLIVLSILSFLSIVGMGNYLNQLKKGHDGKRKKDLGALRTVLEDYYNDKGRYPLTAEMACGYDLSPWLKSVPCETDGSSYIYQTDTGGTYYRIYTVLEFDDDVLIEKVGCQKVVSGGCPGNSSYNYGVSSSNIDL